MGLEVDTANLWRMLQEIDPSKTVRTLKNGMRAAAREIRRRAVRNMLGAGLQGRTGEVAKGIRPVVYRKVAGFKVTVGTKKQRAADYSGMSGRERNQARAFRRLRIVPLWAEGGTEERSSGKGRRGAMPALHFMEKTDQATEGGIDRLIRENIETAIRKGVEKYGGRFS